ncbi:EAL domain-containing protein [Thiomicrorhabdus sediminis]|uniref:EAL domain-containing response regulator n=1 Tax=Thiomicrorhabdus sediminis TaxID=2580412 RepID=A0A4P9K7B3_9GAMM|nr:EAL domain-containing response regulator [Thiomicrorhabdus sediminis]QCU90226.1 EAL domain-containing response regulator [Thiomicrorhabdus sediminis]
MINDVQTVLIVEDSKSQRLMLEELCRHVGIPRILSAEDGMQALQAVNTHQIIDLVLCDLELPVMNGIDFINAVAEDKREFGLVIISGRELSLIKGVELMAESSGFYTLGAFTKPFGESELLDVLHRFQRKDIHVIRSGHHLKKSRITRGELQAALEHCEFHLSFQPKIRFSDYSLVGFEALLRWQHPEYGEIFPGDFVPSLIYHDLIDEVTLDMVEQASRLVAQWREQGLKTKVAINLSSKSFNDVDFFKKLQQRMAIYNATAKQITFEVTETEVIQDISKALAVLNNMKLAGFQLSLDDYGIGESSLNRLTQIPFSELKLDQSLVKGVSNHPYLQAAVESTIGMCRKIGVRVVAEGVESFRDWSYLAELGCDICQGYLVSQPLAESEVVSWYQSHLADISKKLP